MDRTSIKPEKITKPIQLLAAWLVGLFCVDSCFLYAASNMQPGSVESISLVTAAIANVPIFLIAVFLLQTKFRPELQEDSYYSSYLSQKTNQKVTIKKSDSFTLEVSQRLNALEKDLKQPSNQDNHLSGLKVGIHTLLDDREALKHLLSEHHVKYVTSFGNDEKPDKRTVSIAHTVPQYATEIILNIASQSGFTHYCHFDNYAEDTEEEVLFGSYGSADYELT